MELYELIWKRLAHDGNITEGLTHFGGLPSIFVDESPSDEAAGWGGVSHYPRIIFNVDLSANAERKCQGTMILSIFAEAGGSYAFEQAMASIRRTLCDGLLVPKGGAPYCLAWNRSDGFAMEGTNICGQEMQFDILEYPSQVTTDPDPIDALNAYLKDQFPEALVLWHDRLQEEERIAENRPAFYCRLERNAEDESRSTFAVAWMECTMAVHVFCTDGSLRNQYARTISSRLAVDGELDMIDRSPFFITAASFTPGTDYLRTGQVSVSGRYGILRQAEKKKQLTGIKTEYQGG